MKNKQGLTIAALIVAIVGLSVGFAAFSNTLTISSSASVNPDDSALNVVWSSSNQGAQASSISPTLTPNNVTGFTATNGSITGNDYRSLNNISASFTAPGQSVEYSLYVYNAGSLQAQLTGITFNNATNATSGETYKHCYAKTTKTVGNSEVELTSGEMATPSLVASACEGIDISVSIGTATDVTPSSLDKTLNHQILSANGGYLAATVTITYASGSAYVDGPMAVEFGRIDINATSAVNPNAVVVPPTPSTPSEQQSSSILGTYNIFLGTDLNQITLGNNGSASVSAQGQTMPTTYTYDGTNGIVTIDMGGNVGFNYVESGNSKVLYGNMGGMYIFATNTTGFTTLSGTYTGAYSGEETSLGNTVTLNFNTNGDISGYAYDTDYLVINNTVYTNRGNLYFTTNDNFQTLTLYEYHEPVATLTRQS